MTKAKLPNRETQGRFLRFLLVGGTSAVVQFGVLAVMRGRVGDTAAFTVSWVISTALHYCLNRFWALPSSRHDTGRQFAEYLGTIVISYLITLGAFQVAHLWLRLDVMWSTFWAIPTSTIVVFVLLNFRVFRLRAGER